MFEHLSLLQEMVDNGYVNVQKHPDWDLYIYNYAPRTQYERVWNQATLAARGLILDGEGNVVARPFQKFFNMEEHSRSDITFSKPFVITDKMDGSLGIAYRLPDGHVAIATRGSFGSDQARWATEWLMGNYPEYTPSPGTTPLFEIIYPDNRIVVDYNGFEGLVLLAIIDNETGRDIDITNASRGAGGCGPNVWCGEKVKKYSLDCKPRDVVAALNPTDDGNTEGYVLRFDWPKTGPQTRVKVKLEEYCRLHRILTGVSNLSIWEYLKDGKDMGELLDKVPDEFYDWVKSTIRSLHAQYNEITMEASREFNYCMYSTVDELSDVVPGDYCKENRAVFAQYAKNCKYPGLVFSLLDDRHDKYQEAIWKMIRPKFSKPFSNVSSEDA